MTNSNEKTSPTETSPSLPSPLQCLTAALISAAFAIGGYYLTSAIFQSFAAKPITSTNPTAINIAAAVRTLVVGVSSLATFVFGFVALGLVALAIQVTIQQLRNRNNSPSDT
ncbi:MAG: DUF3082 domain-containing protein [Kastovskya adunca ATA6-11-RM4]|jgi:hypothetical protein|nr:DUF3082 domain-containing protein [Kastovskya adunca ATA6-11-RM4]